MDTQTRRALELEVAKRVLDADDLRLFEQIRRGKSFHAMSLLYRKYEGENGAREAYERAQAQVRAAVNGGQRPEAPLAAQVREPEDEGLHSGVPVRTVPAGTLSGAGAAPTPRAEVPPKAPRQPPSSAPKGLAAVTDSPALQRPRAVRVPAEQRVQELLAALAEGPRTMEQLCDLLGCSDKTVRRAASWLRHEGKLEVRGRGGRGQPPPLYLLTDGKPPS